MTTISIRKMAEALGVSKSQVARDAQAGMPMTDVAAARTWRLETHDVSRTVEGRIDRPGPQASARTGTKDNPPEAEAGMAAGPGAADPVAPGSQGSEPDDENTSAYREHRATRERINAERAQIELDQLRGRLIDLEEAKRLAFTAFRTLRDAVLNVPSRIKDQCAAETDSFKVEQLIENELGAALNNFDPAKVTREADDDEAD